MMDISGEGGTPLVLIQSPDAWETFQTDIASKYRLAAKDIQWGEDTRPESYPCLVSAVGIESTIVCLFVYERDAIILMESATTENRSPPFISEIDLINAPDSDSSLDAQPGLWNRHMVALLLTIVHEMKSVGITKSDRFEGILRDMLKVVEYKHTQDVEAVKRLINEQLSSDKNEPEG
jgi:hypothetical protein